MARFGLSDTESDSDHSQHSDSATSSPPPPRRRTNKRSSRSVSYTSTRPSGSEDEQATEEEEDEDAPPRASLAYSDGSQHSDDDDEQDDSMNHPGSLSPPPRLRRQSTREHSYSLSVVKDRSSSPELQQQRPTRQQPQPWASKLKLEPKRVAVMQASFFQQQDSAPATQQRKEPNKSAGAALPAAASPFVVSLSRLRTRFSTAKWLTYYATPIDSRPHPSSRTFPSRPSHRPHPLPPLPHLLPRPSLLLYHHQQGRESCRLGLGARTELQGWMGTERRDGDPQAGCGRAVRSGWQGWK